MIGWAALGAAWLAPTGENAPHQDRPPVENFIRVNDRVYSGGKPAGDAAFARLAELGVRTVISVDESRPDLGRAGAHGIRYVHIPIGYETMSEADQLRVARAIRDLPGPLFIHCHQGKHRGPTAVAAGLVRLGQMTSAEGEAFLRKAGTSDAYAGLYACVREATPVEASAIDGAGPLPEVVELAGLLAAMAEIDRRFEHLEAARAAGWRTPAHHPDLVPTAEAARIAELFREMSARRNEPGMAPRIEVRSGENAERMRDRATRHYWRLIDSAAEKSDALAEALAADIVNADEAERAIRAVGASCVACHMSFRN